MEDEIVEDVAENVGEHEDDVERCAVPSSN